MHFRPKCCPQGIPTMPHTAWHPRPVFGLLVAASATLSSQILYACTICISWMTPSSAAKSNGRWTLLYQGCYGLWVPTQLALGKQVRLSHERRVLRSVLLKAAPFEWVYTFIIFSLWWMRPKQLLRQLQSMFLIVCTKWWPVWVLLMSKNSTFPGLSFHRCPFQSNCKFSNPSILLFVPDSCCKSAWNK